MLQSRRIRGCVQTNGTCPSLHGRNQNYASINRKSLAPREPSIHGPSEQKQADWFRYALEDKEIKPCIPGRKARKAPVKYDKRRYKRRNRIEVMFGRLKDWRRIAVSIRRRTRSRSLDCFVLDLPVPREQFMHP